MIIATVVFGDSIFGHMAEVLEYSVRQNCPDAEFVRIDLDPHEHIKGIPTHCPANAHKKQAWADVVHGNPDREIVLLDCDTLVLADLQHVFEMPFDVAYTVRDHRVRINAGVLFIRSTNASRRFFDKWMSVQQTLLSEQERPHLHARLRKYAGLDQAALSVTLDAMDFPLSTIELPCEIYNSVDQTWAAFSEQTKILHVKGRLRRAAVIENADPSKHPSFSVPLQVWREYAALAHNQGVNYVTT